MGGFCPFIWDKLVVISGPCAIFPAIIIKFTVNNQKIDFLAIIFYFYQKKRTESARFSCPSAVSRLGLGELIIRLITYLKASYSAKTSLAVKVPDQILSSSTEDGQFSKPISKLLITSPSFNLIYCRSIFCSPSR